MWFFAASKGSKSVNCCEPVYVIKYGSSRDGIDWDRPNHQCIPQAHDCEAFSHPTVLKGADRYRMWYCFRHSLDYRDGAGSYRIGYAESPDGLAWSGMDEINGLDTSEEGWSSTMTG